MQEGYQWEEEELLVSYMPHANQSNQLTLEQWAFENGLPFYTHCTDVGWKR